MIAAGPDPIPLAVWDQRSLWLSIRIDILNFPPLVIERNKRTCLLKHFKVYPHLPLL
jgi:hypothetical protein